jgi:hypothetical protein
MGNLLLLPTYSGKWVLVGQSLKLFAPCTWGKLILNGGIFQRIFFKVLEGQ